MSNFKYQTNHLVKYTPENKISSLRKLVGLSNKISEKIPLGTEEEWLAYRKFGVPATEVATIVNANTRNSIVGLYWEKLSESIEKKGISSSLQSIYNKGTSAEFNIALHTVLGLTRLQNGAGYTLSDEEYQNLVSEGLKNVIKRSDGSVDTEKMYDLGLITHYLKANNYDIYSISEDGIMATPDFILCQKVDGVEVECCLLECKTTAGDKFEYKTKGDNLQQIIQGMYCSQIPHCIISYEVKDGRGFECYSFVHDLADYIDDYENKTLPAVKQFLLNVENKVAPEMPDNETMKKLTTEAQAEVMKILRNHIADSKDKLNCKKNKEGKKKDLIPTSVKVSDINDWRTRKEVKQILAEISGHYVSVKTLESQEADIVSTIKSLAIEISRQDETDDNRTLFLSDFNTYSKSLVMKQTDIHVMYETLCLALCDINKKKIQVNKWIAQIKYLILKGSVELGIKNYIFDWEDSEIAKMTVSENTGAVTVRLNEDVLEARHYVDKIDLSKSVQDLNDNFQRVIEASNNVIKLLKSKNETTTEA